MKRTMLFVSVFFVLTGFAFANSSPTVTQVTASPRTDSSGYVDISFRLTDADNDRCNISLLVSNDGGSTWMVTPSPSALSGDIGENISCGNRHITWNSKAALPGVYGTNYRIMVIADDGIVDDPAGMVWVYINDSGEGMKSSNGIPIDPHGGFTGYMSKYETTNAQYCQFLNAARTSSDITVNGNNVIGANGSNRGVDFADQVYYNLVGEGYTYNGATNGGAARINWDGSSFTVDSGFENHPITYVSWYGSTEFANYYSWRLPTMWEWQAVADFDGSYRYGCGTTIYPSKANYSRFGSYPHGTTPVDTFESYGHGMNDMAGNVWEWTSTPCGPGESNIRGGSWVYIGDYYCTVFYTVGGSSQGHMSFDHGFRVCR